MGTDYYNSQLTKIQSFDQVMTWKKMYEKTNRSQQHHHVYDWFVGQGFISEHDKTVALQTYNLINTQYETVKMWWKNQNTLTCFQEGEKNFIELKMFLSENDGFVF